MKTVNAYTELMEAIEARFESEDALDDLEHQALDSDRLDARDREHVLRRIAFYRSDFHARLRASRRRASQEQRLP